MAGMSVRCHSSSKSLHLRSASLTHNKMHPRAHKWHGSPRAVVQANPVPYGGTGHAVRIPSGGRPHGGQRSAHHTALSPSAGARTLTDTRRSAAGRMLLSLSLSPSPAACRPPPRRVGGHVPTAASRPPHVSRPALT